MPVEIECKLKVDSHEPVRQRLAALGAERLKHVLETNHLFDRADGSLRAAGCALRVREYCSLDRNRPAPLAAVTFKGPPRRGTFKAREEIEFSVSDAGSAMQFLTELSFIERMRFEKRREAWRLQDCQVELDELPYLGFFVEVEGPSEQAVHDQLKALELPANSQERRAYAGLLDEHARIHNLNPLELRFSER